MKVILLQNVPKIGQKGDVKDLKEGYVRNMLLPKGLAKIATQGELNKLQKIAEKEEEYQNAELKRVSEIFNKLENQTIEINENSNEKGHLFAKVGSDEIIEAVKSKYSVELEEDWFNLVPIKEVGEYTVELKFQKLHKNFIIKII